MILAFEFLAAAWPRNPLAGPIDHAHESNAFANGANRHSEFKRSAEGRWRQRWMNRASVWKSSSVMDGATAVL
jgi:hypothetical protein